MLTWFRWELNIVTKHAPSLNYIMSDGNACDKHIRLVWPTKVTLNGKLGREIVGLHLIQRNLDNWELLSVTVLWRQLE